MQNERYTDFDLEMRGLFQDAEEQVPSRVWDAVSSELDRRDRRKVVALRWRRAAVGVAAAAAVMSGIFVTANLLRNDSPAASSPVLAQVGDVHDADADISEPADVLDLEEQLASSRSLYLADVPQALPKSRKEAIPSEIQSAEELAAPVASEETEEIENVADKAEKAVVRTDTKKETEVSKPASAWTDPFADIDDEEEKEHRSVSLVLSGNAMSNDITGGSSQSSRAPAANQARTGISEKSVSTYGVPLTLGAGARFSLTDRLAIGTGINWSLLSRSFTGIYTEVGTSGLVSKSINSEIVNDLHYVGIPLNLYYDILTNRNLKFYVWGGGSAEKGIVNRFRIHTSTDDIFYSESVRGIQWSTALGLGLEFSLGEHLGLYLDPSARYYFDCGQPTSVRTQKPYMFNFEVGIRFDL